VARLVERENVTVNGHNATVMDVYRTPGAVDQVHLLARLGFDGNRTDRGFVVGEETGNPLVLRYGATFDVQAHDYQLPGSVLTVGDDRTFETRERQVVLNVSTTDPVASVISEGDTHRIAGQPVATVERADRTARANETVYVEVTLSVEALSIEGHDEYAGTPIRLGRTLPFETDQYAVRGTVIEVGT
jgi:hypothetical protein